MSTSMPLSRRVLKQVAQAPIGEHQFSVVTYNILADHWVRHHSHVKEKYPFCPNEFKTRAYGRDSHRHKLLLAELRWLDGDIVCLQEVDTDYFTDILKGELSLLRYEALYVESLDRPEGVALAFKRDKFQLVKNSKVVINDLAQRTFKQCDLPKFTSAFLLAALRHTATKNLLVIGVTHLPWGKLLKTVMQVCEIALVTQAMDDLIKSMETQGEQVTHILCGDFNIEPQFPAYEFLKGGRLTDKEFGRLKTVDYIYFGNEFPDEQPTKIQPDQLSLLNMTKTRLQNPLTTLQSAYKTVMGTEPQFTNHEGGADVWTLDYIWFDSSSLNVTAALETVPKSAVEPYGGLPNKFFPSDHLSLKAHFEFVGKKNIPDN